ncbi:MAG TPA: dihydrolipoamide acetyltransferase family protein [Methylomirabilota bacterium]|jgi:pyruvate dehydrogenase E2 component (dihydrolipoamide acetyltransferase)|nr:dihydrolipoamide acetyltransferase family protein [Methylomirabilota bacterium]
MAIEVLMPRLSDTMEEGKILKWLKKVGDKIEVGDIIAEVETDKADMEMEALDAGVLAEIRVREGESAPVNAVIAVLSEAGESVTPAEPQKTEPARKPVVSAPPPPSAPTEAKGPAKPAAGNGTVQQPAPPAGREGGEVSKPATTGPRTSMETSVEQAPTPKPPPVESASRLSAAAPERKVRELRETRPRREMSAEAVAAEDRVFASPLVRRMAQEQGIDLRKVRGSGPGGRIVKQDLEKLGGAQEPAATVQMRVTEQPHPDLSAQPAAAPAGRKEPFSRMRATIAKRMAESMREIPHFYVTVEIDMSEAVRMRAALKASARVTVDVTYTHFLIKAVAIALQQHPRLNASFAGDGRELKAEINIGVAVSLEDGLIVPVLHGCDKLSLLEIAAAANALVERARAGKPTQEDLSGGTFTISNMGMLPVEHFTAIINPPQGAILAVGAIKERPVVRNGEIRAAHTMMATLSCDHRILDGVTGGQFLADVKKLLENPVGLMV